MGVRTDCQTTSSGCKQLSPEQALFRDKYIKCFTNVSSIVFLSCCQSNINVIRDVFNSRETPHTSSVARESTHQLFDFFHTSADGLDYILNEIKDMLMKVPLCPSNGCNIPEHVAEYITPYIINQIMGIYKTQRFVLQDTDLQ